MQVLWMFRTAVEQRAVSQSRKEDQDQLFMEEQENRRGRKSEQEEKRQTKDSVQGELAEWC